MGSIISLTDGTGSAVGAYTRDSFGKDVSTADTLGNRYRYTAREWDSETGLYYYRARYYDPSSGRLVSEDSLEFIAGTNFYAYVVNNPTNLIDPSGFSPKPVKPYRWRYCTGTEHGVQAILSGAGKEVRKLYGFPALSDWAKGLENWSIMDRRSDQLFLFRA